MEGVPNEIDEVAKLLQATFMSTNDPDRRKAEETLVMLSKDSAKFLEILLSIVTQSSNNQLFNKIRDAAATYIAAYIRTQIQTEVYSPQQKTTQLQAIFGAMISENVGYTLKIHLAACMTNLLSMDMSEDLKIAIFPVLINALSTGKKHPVLAGLMGIQSLVSATTIGLQLAKVFQESMKTLNPLASELINLILTDIGKLVLQGAGADQNQIIQKIIENMTILKTWAETIKLFVAKMYEKKGTLLQNVTGQEGLIQSFVQILCIQIPTEKQITECIISTSGYNDFDNICNDIKSLILKSLNIITTFIFEARPELVQTSKFYSFLLTGVPLVISTLIKFCKNDQIDLDTALTLEPIEGFIVECLIFLTHIASQTEFFNIFADTKKSLFIDVILPLLRSSKSELELFRDGPEEFVHLALDTCDKQLSETYKTAAAQFMEILCDHIDGSLTFISVIALQIINYSLISDNVQEIPTKFTVLAEISNSTFLTKTNATIRVETCLVVLSVLSYLIPRRNDLMALLEQTLHSYHQFFINNKTDGLIRSRICLLIGYYAENIFQDDIKFKDMYALHITFLVQSVGLTDPSDMAVALQAIDSLSNIFDDEDLVPRMSRFITEILYKFSNFIVFMRHNQFYDIIQEIVKTYSHNIAEKQDLVINIVQMLVMKIKSELETTINSEQNTNIIINKCWNIIRAIAEQKAYMPYQPQIEQSLTPLLVYMEDPTKIDFDDDILLMLTAFIKKTGQISETSWKLFTTFPKFFQKYQGMFGNLFPALNYFIIYGRQFLIQQIEFLDIIINMGVDSLFTKAKSSNEANHAEGAVLFQLLIYYCGEALSPDRWEKIFSATLERLSKEIKKPFLRARLYGVFLCGFYRNYLLTQEILVIKNQMGPLLVDILEKLGDFGHLYDRKLFILGLSTILVQTQLAPIVSEKFTQIFDSLITMLKFVQYLESNQKKKKFNDSDDSDNETPNETDILQKFLVQNSDGQEINMPVEDHKMEESSDEDDDEELNYFGENDEVEAKLTVDGLKTDIKAEDEFAYFKNIIIIIKEKNPTALKQFIDQLPEAKQNYLRHVLQTQRILINPDDKKFGARRVVKIKGKKIGGPGNLNDNQEMRDG